jgi:hypothetical protein
MQKFTPNDLLLYVLNELDQETHQVVHQAKLDNPMISKEIEELQFAVQDISNYSLAPNTKSMEAVLQKLNVGQNIEIL